MLRNRPLLAQIACAVASTALIASLSYTAFAQSKKDKQIGVVFYIELENHNWTQPKTDTTPPFQLAHNKAAPYLNSLVTPGNPNSDEVSYATHYHNVLATPSGNNPSIHPSEPNYIWQEAGWNFGIFNDNDPYSAVDPSVPAIQAYLAMFPTFTGEHLTGLMEANGLTWKAYQEDIDMQTTTGSNGNLGGTLTSTVVAKAQWTVPLSSFSGTSTTYVNEFNGSGQWNFACKHDGTLFFPDTNGGNVPDASNTQRLHYAPMQQLFSDLNSNKVARYNLITPDQYNDMHSSLQNGFTYHGVAYPAGDLAQIAEGDNFLSIVIPFIMASQAYQDNGVIVIWEDESENANDFSHTLPFIVISKLAKGHAFASRKNMTHSTDLATWQKVFGLRANTPSGYLNDAANPTLGGTTDISDLFVPGVIPKDLPPF